ncbi:MAG: metal ABC transporter permease [Caldilineaceae bacterium SB0664_bin_27]|uniref:Metal ABC transporter permease n=1 Tax=Caldilineaceae bacterium SB0664_bin_27 TaxID=2605260 RepID=A0A6B0YQM5_9CHLR|nr:metal ABC transporter permease [Caldilineaceae bacterium SB0664_bin_27]
MFFLEEIVIQLLLNFVAREDLNAFLRNPQHTATIVGSLIAVSGALLGTFLLLRGMSLTSDAISHTVLLGIVVAFILMGSVFGQHPDLSSVWLIAGAAAAGVATVLLTELIYRSGLVKQDAALGLAFPLLFAIAVILVSRVVSDVHLDEDAVMVGEIGVAWANTNSHCLSGCESVTINPDDPRAELTRQCTNCRSLGISPRDDKAEFTEICTNCGQYSPAQAWQAGFTKQEPVLVFWPKSITVMAVMTVLTLLAIVLFYKELKLSTFDPTLAAALGFRPTLLHYGLMVLVSLVAVGAFDAVGSILVVAFFIIPPAAAYLLTDRLPRMLLYSSLIGAAGAYSGYDLARGNLLGIVNLSDVFAMLNDLFGLGLSESWDSSISASMVLMTFFFFLVAWAFSPKYGLVSTMLRRRNQRRSFDHQVVLGHIHHHQDSPAASEELAVSTLYRHFRWTPAKMQRTLRQLRARNLVQIEANLVSLTERGETHAHRFRETQLTNESVGE